MAAGERLGGLAPATRAAAQALAAAFDVVVVETVGVGQSETEVAEAADTVAVVVQPGRRRRAPVPQGRDHGGPRRPRRHEGRPRHGRRPRGPRPARRAALARRRRAGPRGVLRPPGHGDRGARRRARARTARGSTSRRPAPARAASARSPTSWPSTASAACARSAAAGPPSASWPSRTRRSRRRRSSGARVEAHLKRDSPPLCSLALELHHLRVALRRAALADGHGHGRRDRRAAAPIRLRFALRVSCARNLTLPALAMEPLPETRSFVPSFFAVFLSAVSVSLTVQAAVQSHATAMPFFSALRV